MSVNKELQDVLEKIKTRTVTGPAAVSAMLKAGGLTGLAEHIHEITGMETDFKIRVLISEGGGIAELEKFKKTIRGKSKLSDLDTTNIKKIEATIKELRVDAYIDEIKKDNNINIDEVINKLIEINGAAALTKYEKMVQTPLQGLLNKEWEGSDEQALQEEYDKLHITTEKTNVDTIAKLKKDIDEELKKVSNVDTGAVDKFIAQTKGTAEPGPETPAASGGGAPEAPEAPEPPDEPSGPPGPPGGPPSVDSKPKLSFKEQMAANVAAAKAAKAAKEGSSPEASPETKSASEKKDTKDAKGASDISSKPMTMAEELALQQQGILPKKGTATNRPPAKDEPKSAAQIERDKAEQKDKEIEEEDQKEEEEDRLKQSDDWGDDPEVEKREKARDARKTQRTLDRERRKREEQAEKQETALKIQQDAQKKLEKKALEDAKTAAEALLETAKEKAKELHKTNKDTIEKIKKAKSCTPELIQEQKNLKKQQDEMIKKLEDQKKQIEKSPLGENISNTQKSLEKLIEAVTPQEIPTETPVGGSNEPPASPEPPLGGPPEPPLGGPPEPPLGGPPGSPPGGPSAPGGWRPPTITAEGAKSSASKAPGTEPTSASPPKPSASAADIMAGRQAMIIKGELANMIGNKSEFYKAFKKELGKEKADDMMRTIIEVAIANLNRVDKKDKEADTAAKLQRATALAKAKGTSEDLEETIKQFNISTNDIKQGVANFYEKLPDQKKQSLQVFYTKEKTEASSVKKDTESAENHTPEKKAERANQLKAFGLENLEPEETNKAAATKALTEAVKNSLITAKKDAELLDASFTTKFTEAEITAAEKLQVAVQKVVAEAPTAKPGVVLPPEVVEKITKAQKAVEENIKAIKPTTDGAAAAPEPAATAATTPTAAETAATKLDPAVELAKMGISPDVIATAAPEILRNAFNMSQMLPKSPSAIAAIQKSIIENVAAEKTATAATTTPPSPVTTPRASTTAATTTTTATAEPTTPNVDKKTEEVPKKEEPPKKVEAEPHVEEKPKVVDPKKPEEPADAENPKGANPEEEAKKPRVVTPPKVETQPPMTQSATLDNLTQAMKDQQQTGGGSQEPASDPMPLHAYTAHKENLAEPASSLGNKTVVVTREKWNKIKAEVKAKNPVERMTSHDGDKKITLENTKIDIENKDTEVTVSSKDPKVKVEVLVANYKITAKVLGQTECAIGKSPSAEVTAKLITALNEDPPIKPILSGKVLAQLKESEKRECQKALELYQNFDTNHPELKKAGPKASA